MSVQPTTKVEGPAVSVLSGAIVRVRLSALEKRELSRFCEAMVQHIGLDDAETEGNRILIPILRKLQAATEMKHPNTTLSRAETSARKQDEAATGVGSGNS